MKLRFADAAVGVVLGALILVIWWVVRSDVYPLDRSAGLALIASVFVSAGLLGGIRSGTVAGGVQVGLVTGVVSALTVPGEYLLFDVYRPDAASIVVSVASSTTVVLTLAAAGAALTTLPKQLHRLGRAIHVTDSPPDGRPRPSPAMLRPLPPSTSGGR
jgi:hypothetical protein